MPDFKFNINSVDDLNKLSTQLPDLLMQHMDAKNEQAEEATVTEKKTTRFGVKGDAKLEVMKMLQDVNQNITNLVDDAVGSKKRRLKRGRK
ncbi:hypothetical protein [Pseudalkalibacillus decolorationis]|uniref:hypothetical protein n=1 Tax=Pseudalkalibacillus decolorationis TaxID=163879 RepID=UPI002147751C|nr:hypothetical protein [Pseudalkalibacillus decolorationis]